MRAVTEQFDERTGRTVYRVGRFTYTVEDYDAETYTVYSTARDGMDNYVGERRPASLPPAKLRYARHEVLCEAAWRAAHSQARA